MTEYNKVNVQSSDSQLNNIRSAVRNITRVTLRMNIKMFDGGRTLINNKTKD